jgi:hypothetical protein
MELCRNWTGSGCACAVFDLEPDIVDDDGSALSASLPVPEGDSPAPGSLKRETSSRPGGRGGFG